jgi:hypothetical protein
LAKLLSDRRPLVFAVEEFIPVVFGLLPWDEFPEGRNVQDDAVVEIRFEM